MENSWLGAIRRNGVWVSPDFYEYLGITRREYNKDDRS